MQNLGNLFIQLLNFIEFYLKIFIRSYFMKHLFLIIIYLAIEISIIRHRITQLSVFSLSGNRRAILLSDAASMLILIVLTDTLIFEKEPVTKRYTKAFSDMRQHFLTLMINLRKFTIITKHFCNIHFF